MPRYNRLVDHKKQLVMGRNCCPFWNQPLENGCSHNVFKKSFYKVKIYKSVLLSWMIHINN